MVAKGGSAIKEWQRNLSEDSLYGSMLKRVFAASTVGKIKGLIFMQGETDALDKNKYPKVSLNWKKNFSQFVHDFRSDLNDTNLPVVFSQLGPRKAERHINWKHIKDEQMGVELPHCKMIKTDDLSLLDDVHFDIESSCIIGERLSEAMNGLQSHSGQAHELIIGK